MSDFKLMDYQESIVEKAVSVLNENRKVGLHLFTRGGKSYIAMALIEKLIMENKCNNVLVLAPKSVLDNLKNNLFNQFRFYNRLCFVNYEKLSRMNTLEDCIVNQGFNPNSIDIVLIDEAHTAFGLNRYKMLQEASSYVYSKYVIAMTATPVSNSKLINTLSELVGSDNVVVYSHTQAINEGVAKPVNYIPVMLSYDTASIKKLNEIKQLNLQNPYILDLIRKLEDRINSTNKSKYELVFEHLKDRMKLSCADGARVFAFFNRTEDVINDKEYIINVVKQLYKYWGNTNISVRYINYTSCASRDEINTALNIIGSKPIPNCVDIISTVDKGAMGIHPDNVQFGMIMCATGSLQRMLQMIGRLTNLCRFDVCDTNIFDARNNISVLGKQTINIGKRQIRDRRKYKLDEAIGRFSSDSSFDSSLIDGVKLTECDELVNNISLMDRIENIAEAMKISDSFLDFIIQNLEEIDSEFNGNIEKFIMTLYNSNDCSKSFKEELKIYRIQLLKVRNIMLFDGYTEEDKKFLDTKVGMLSYRIMLSNSNSKDTDEFIKELYLRCEELRDCKKIPKDFKDAYAEKYITGEMSSICMAIIQRHENIEIELTKCIKKLTFDTEDGKLVRKLCSRLELIAKNLSENLATMSDTDIEIGVTKLMCNISYLRYVDVDDVQKKYIDTYIKYVGITYSNLLNLSYWGKKTHEDYVVKIMRIINALYNDSVHELTVSSDNLIAYIANNFENIHYIYKEILSIYGITNTKKFNKEVVLKTKMAMLIDEAINENNSESLYKLKEYMWGDSLPSLLKGKLKNRTIKTMLMNVSQRDIKIAVQSINYKPEDSSKLLRKLLRNGSITYIDIIALVYNGAKYDYVKELLNNYSYSVNENIIHIRKYNDTVAVSLLQGLKDNKVLNKEYSLLVDKIIG